MRYIWFFFVFFFVTLGYAQNQLDSLIDFHKTLKPTNAYKEEIFILDKIVAKAKVQEMDSLIFEMSYRKFQVYGALSMPDSQRYTVIEVLETSSFLKTAYTKLGRLRLLGDYLYSNNKFDSAYVVLMKALDLTNESPELQRTKTLVLSAIGQVQHARSELIEAVDYLERAILYSEKHNLSSFERSVYFNNLAQVYSALKNYRKQIECLRASLSIKDSLNMQNDLEYLISINNLGLAYRNQGDYLLSMDFLRRAMMSFKEELGETHRFYAIGLNNVSLAHLNLKDLDSALYYAKKSLRAKEEIFRKDNFDIAVSCNQLGVIYRELEKYNIAAKFFKRAALAFGIDSYYYPSMMLNIFKLYKKQHDAEAMGYYAKHAHQRAKKLYNRDIGLADTYKALADYYDIVGESEISLLYYDSALRVQNFHFKGSFDSLQNPVTLYNTLVHKGLMLKKYGQDSSINYMLKAVELNEYLALQTLSDRDRLLIKSANAELIKGAVETLYYQSLLSQDSDVYGNLLLFTDVNKSFLLRNNLISYLESDTTINHILSLQNKIDSLKEVDQSNKAQSMGVHFQIELEKLKEKCSVCGMDLPSLEDYKKLNGQIRKDEGIVSYYLSDAHIYIIYANNENVKLFRRELPNSFNYWLESLKDGYLPNVYDSLSNYLLDNEFLDKRHLIFIPDGQLGMLNFELLKNQKDKWLLYDHIIHTHPSVYSFLNRAKNEKQRNVQGEIMALAPVFDNLKEPITSAMVTRDASFALPGTEKEVLLLQKQLKAKISIRDEVTKSQTIKALRQFGIVHLATHALINIDNPLISEILVYNNQSIKAYEILRSPVRSNLVFLSACNTGVGKYFSGEGIISLASSFLSAGAKSVIMTPWKIPDETTPEIVGSFYENLAKGMYKAEALRQAKLTYLENQADPLKRHPNFWAGFVLVGNDEPIYLETNHFDKWYWITGLLLFVSLLVGAKAYLYRL